MSKGGKTTTTTGPDSQTQEYINKIMQSAQQQASAGAPGANPLTTGAGNYYGSAQTAGNLGLGALSGDPASVSQLMSPYQQQVIDANNTGWQRTNANSVNQVNDAATRTGAWGGSRAAIAQGTALSQNNQAQQQQTASLLNGGYTQAMGQATSLANLGMGGAQGAASLGDYLRNIQMQQQPGAYQSQVLKGALSGLPTGTTQTQTQSGNWLSGLGGLLTTGLGLWNSAGKPTFGVGGAPPQTGTTDPNNPGGIFG